MHEEGDLMLTYYGVYNDIGWQGIVMLSVLFAVGIVTASFLNTPKAKLIISLCAAGMLVLFEIGILLPTPKVLCGDGYAITQEISLIGATYLAPIVVGVIFCCVTKFLVTFIRSKRRQI